MTASPIEYILPTSRSFEGMKRILFRPFDMGKWFALGFSAWLAGLLDGGGGGGGGGGSADSRDSSGGGGFGEWVAENLVLVIVIGAVVAMVLTVVILALLWVSSRGKFMFLDNVVHNRAEVKRPWNQFRALGDSLFLWRLVFGMIVFLIVLAVAGGCGLLSFAMGKAAWVAIIPGILMLVPVVLAAIYVSILLEDFVIPLMYRDTLKANAAWRRFLALHRTDVFSFVLFALWKTLLWIAAFGIIVAVGLGTCCIGFLLMAIPYIGAVILLPVSVFFRFLGPEFLRQFGGDYNILPEVPELPDATAT